MGQEAAKGTQEKKGNCPLTFFTSHLLPLTFYLLLITYYLSPITYYLSLITYYFFFNSSLQGGSLALPAIPNYALCIVHYEL